MSKKKKSTNTSPYPDEVIDRLARAFYPAILACWNSEEGQRSLVGARPLHLACARPFGRLKAPLGLSLLRCAAQTRACLWQAEQAHHANNEKQEVPAGNSLLYISLSSVAFGRVRPGGRTLFLFYTLIEKNFVSYCKSLYIFSYCSIQTFAASIPQSSRFMDRALIHPKKFMKVI